MPSADDDLGPQHLSEPARTVTAEPPDRSPEHAEPSRFIPHVQGLRAIAVLAVVLYHFWPARFSGGYVGVDIFFVISGFLITSHLMRELTATGGIRLGQFWARRARRLLPASLLVLLFCALVAMSPYLTPTSALPNEVREILASTFYVENWYLALNSADYLNHSGDPTTVQHYWSLSLEEQFYVMWPLLMLLAAWIGVKWFRGARRRAVITTLAVVSVVSFAFCVVFTITNPAPAYFVTFGRMWQFGLGAMVALVPMLRIRKAIGSFVLGWAGIAVLIFVIFRFDAQTPFPGYAAALPSLGAAAVIMASNHERWWYPTRVLAIRPAQFAGNISYSLYLWHWPLIIIAPSVPFWGLTIYHRLALLALCFVLAWLTKRFVEDPARGWRVLTSRPARVTLWSSLAAMVLVASVAGAAWAFNAPAYSAGVQALQDLRENPPPCFGAAVVLDPACAGTDFGTTILPAPGFAGGSPDVAGVLRAAQRRPARLVHVRLGRSERPPGRPHRRQPRLSAALDLPGDGRRERLAAHHVLQGRVSVEHHPPRHARRVRGGVHAVARQRHRRAEGCRPRCRVHGGSRRPRPTRLPATRRRTTRRWPATGMPGARCSTGASPSSPSWTIPCRETDPNKCLRTHPQADCSGDRSTVLVTNDPLRDAASGLDRATLLDFTDVFCGADLCRPVVGGANIYRDQDHLTVTFTDTLKPWYTQAIQAALTSRGQ